MSTEAGAIQGEWRRINDGQSKLRHRRKKYKTLDELTLTHLAMLRLPEPTQSKLFERQGLTQGWTRCYGGEREVDLLLAQPSVDSLCALVLLTDEAAKIGDARRFVYAREAVLSLLPDLVRYPGCRRIGERLGFFLIQKLMAEEFSPRRYSRAPSHGTGLPTSWLILAYGRELESYVDARFPIVEEP